jgi:predicted peptidase
MRIILSLFVLSLPLAAQTKPGFHERKHKNADGHLSPYVVFVPHDYDGKKEVPVILFLHGSGETKPDPKSPTKSTGKMPVEVGIGTHIKAHEKSFPFLTVIPRAEKRPWSASSEDGKRAIAILDEVMKEYKVDPKRQYLTGLSMGGYGTWSLAEAYPDRWAAIVPICGGVREKPEDVAKKIKDIPCWCFHGDADAAVKVEKSRELIEALKKDGAKPKYTEYPGVGHNSWDKAYGTEELWVWLAKQKKS